MTSPSNLYAEKVFAEHPLGLWTFDDDTRYASLLTKSEQRLSGWTVTNATVSANASLIAPISDEPVIKISSLNASTVRLVSPVVTNFASLDQLKDSLAMSVHLYSGTDTIQNVRLGYVYESDTTFQNIVAEDFSLSVFATWAFLSSTFSVPTENTGNFKLVIEIETSVPGDYEFFINGLSLGQWSEPFNTESVGAQMSLLPETINLPSAYAVEAAAYGLSENNGYYLGSATRLYATNDGFPMVYGSSNVTRVVPNPNGPSLIFPGFGFLNDSGQYKDLTVEMWIKIDSRSTTHRRIFGPISSNDGLYVDSEFLVLKIGDSIGSYFVGEWNRPMLLHIRSANNLASLMVNGEEVISMSVDTDNLNLPGQYSSTVPAKSQDWLGVYAYDDVPEMYVDCFAIYSYNVPTIVAKRRFVYGQGVEFPELSNPNAIGSSAYIDYSVANYASNYMYPDMGRWSQGIIENVSVDNNSLSSPQYVLPETIFNNKEITQKQWLQLCSQSDSSESFASIDLSLANSVTASGGYLFFKSFNILSQEVKGFYGVFKQTLSGNQILFKIKNSADGSSFVISTYNNKVRYILNYESGKQIVVESADSLPSGQIFTVGIDIEKFATRYGGPIAKFFGSSRKLSLYVGGQEDFSQTFSGRIYKVGFSTKRNLNKLSNIVNLDGTISSFGTTDNIIFAESLSVEVENYITGGTPDTSSWTEDIIAGGVVPAAVLIAIEHVASYNLNPRLYLGSFILDISTDSYWQDYIPLSYLSKAIENAEGDLVQTIDFVQFNINNPIIKKYLQSNYDTSNNQVRSYITFQYLSTGANSSDDKFVYTQSAPANGVIYPGSEWINTRYEVVDGTVVYMPAGANPQKVAIVLHVHIVSSGILTNPVTVKTLQLASQALSSITKTDINTRFGDSLTPYSMRGIYADYKAKNPFSIYKGSTPYLYLTGNSGIVMRGEFSASSKKRGIRSYVNKQRSKLYRVGAVQMLARYDDQSFKPYPEEIARFSAKNKTVSLMAVKSGNSERGEIYAIDAKTNLIDSSVVFFLNGIPQKRLFILPGQWNMVGIQFSLALDFNSYMGYFDVTGPLMFNGISNYRLSSTQDSTSSIFRIWSQLLTMRPSGIALRADDPATTGVNESLTTWQDFLDSVPATSWENILFIPVIKRYTIDPATIYKQYAGTNKIVVQDDNVLTFKNYQYRMLSDLSWQSSIIQPV